MLNVVLIATHGHGHVSTHVRWLYNLIRVANAAVCKFMQVLSCFACGKTFKPLAELEKKMCAQSRPQADDTDAQVSAE